MTMKTDKDKRWPAIGDEFEWDGVKLIAVECDGKGCTHCYFNRYSDERKSKGCVDHVCEASRRIDGKNIKFRKVRR